MLSFLQQTELFMVGPVKFVRLYHAGEQCVASAGFIALTAWVVAAVRYRIGFIDRSRFQLDLITAAATCLTYEATAVSIGKNPVAAMLACCVLCLHVLVCIVRGATDSSRSAVTIVAAFFADLGVAQFVATSAHAGLTVSATRWLDLGACAFAWIAVISFGYYVVWNFHLLQPQLVTT